MSITVKKDPYVTDAVVERFKQNHPGLAIIVGGGSLEFVTDALSEQEQEALSLDWRFFSANPSVPLENLGNRLDNYIPENLSQEEVLKYAAGLVAFSDVSRPAGLFIYGDVGVGKTHIAVGTAKEFMRRGLSPFYLRADDYPRLRKFERELGPRQVWIIDDLNSPYGFGMGFFKKVVLNTHERGGRVITTSNTHYNQLMEHAFVTDPQERPRYMDRTKNTFSVLWVEGTSHRERTAWHADVGFDPLNPQTYR